MQGFTLRDLKLAVGGSWVRHPVDNEGRETDDSGRAAPVKLGAICTDTRTILPGDAFVALRGDTFDGAEFLETAQQRGASVLVTSRIPEGFVPRVPTLMVPDSLAAYGRIARAWRDQQRACVVGITGSNGKTTTRELCTQVLSRQFQVLQNEANENNQVGVPRTLLRLNERHDFAVIEMGTSEPGEIAALAAIGGPQCGILTSIGESHLEGLGSVEGVLHEKSALLKALPRDGIAIVNYDDPNCIRAAMVADCRIVSYGTDARCELRATNIRGNRWGTQFVLNGKHEFRMPLHGLHNVSNALAALAVGWVSGVDPYEMQIALRRILPVGRRLQYANLGGVHVLDDSYNANPASTKAALRTLAGFEGEGQRIAVLGDMLELGDHTTRLHREVAELAASLAIDLVITVGPNMGAAAAMIEHKFMEAGRGSVWRFEFSAAAAEQLAAEVQPGDVVLVKGSNGMRMNTVVNELRRTRAEAVESTRWMPTSRERPVGDPLPARIPGTGKHVA